LGAEEEKMKRNWPCEVYVVILSITVVAFLQVFVATVVDVVRSPTIPPPSRPTWDERVQKALTPQNHSDSLWASLERKYPTLSELDGFCDPLPAPDYSNEPSTEFPGRTVYEVNRYLVASQIVHEWETGKREQIVRSYESEIEGEARAGIIYVWASYIVSDWQHGLYMPSADILHRTRKYAEDLLNDPAQSELTQSICRRAIQILDAEYTERPVYRFGRPGK